MLPIKITLQAQGLKFGLFAMIYIKVVFFTPSNEGRFRRLHSAAPCESVYGLHMFATRRYLQQCCICTALSVLSEGWGKT